MEKILLEMSAYLAGSLIHNWLPLVLAALTAALLLVYIDPEKLKKRMLEKTNISVPVSVALGAFTPLCACGTMAVIIGILTTTLPWGPIMAFLTSSPLMSPDGFILTAGIIGTQFAIALAAASIVLGIGSGYLTHLVEKKTAFLQNQVRLPKKEQLPNVSVVQKCSCPGTISHPVQLESSGCNQSSTASLIGHKPPESDNGLAKFRLCCINTVHNINYDKTAYFDFMLLSAAANISNKILKSIKGFKWKKTGEALFNIGIKQILLYYIIFASIGFLINRVIPSSLIASLLGTGNISAVPLAAVMGLPLYFNGESAIPLIKSLMDSGASDGAMLAFLITGPGTSAGVTAGIAVILKKRAVFLYLFFLLSGGIILGYLYELFLFFS